MLLSIIIFRSLGTELREIKNNTRSRNLRRKIMNMVYDSQQEEFEEEEAARRVN